MRHRFDYELTTRELVESAKPHYGAAVGAIIAAASTYYSAKQQAAQRARAKRTAANAAIQGGGSVQATWAPTANKFSQDASGGGGDRLGNIFSQSAKPSGGASESQQGFSLGMKSLDEKPPESQSFEGTFQADANKALPYDKITDTSSIQPNSGSGGGGGGEAAGYAAQGVQTAAQLYDLIQKNKLQPPPAQKPQMSPMSGLQPTAYQFGIQR